MSMSNKIILTINNKIGNIQIKNITMNLNYHEKEMLKTLYSDQFI